MAHQVFTPPTVFDEPRTVPWPHPQNDLMRFYPPLERGVSVWVLDDGTFTETQPPNNEGVASVYLGGHEYPVSGDEVAALTAAGYGDRIVTVEDDPAPDPLFAAPTADVNPGGYTPQGSAYN